MKRVRFIFPLALAAIFSIGAIASAVSFYPLPPPVSKETPKAERPPSNALGVYSASWQARSGSDTASISGSLVTVESSVGDKYVVGAAFNSLEGGTTVWETHVTRRMGKDMGVQAGALFWEGGFTDLELLAVKSLRAKVAKRPWAVDVGLGVYRWDDIPQYKETGGTAFVAASYGLSKNVTANVSVWSIALSEFTVTRTAAGVGYQF
jgi:hypothetical protein